MATEETEKIADALEAMIRAADPVGRIHKQKYAEIRRDQFDALFLAQRAGAVISALSANTTGASAVIAVPNGALYSEGQRLQLVEGSTIDDRSGFGYGVLSVAGNNVTLDFAPAAHVAAATAIQVHAPGPVHCWFIFFKAAPADFTQQGFEANRNYVAGVEGYFAAQTRDGGDTDIDFRKLWNAVQKSINSHRAGGTASDVVNEQGACSVLEVGTERFFSAYLCHACSMEVPFRVIGEAQATA